MSSRIALLLTCLATACLAQIAPAQAEDAPGLTVDHKAYQPGEQLRFSTRVELQLTTTVLLGFFAQELSYELVEEETVVVTMAAADDEDSSLQRVSYPLAQRTSVVPVVGEKVKDRRVSGKSYVVHRDDDGLTVSNPDGTDTREKEAREVRRSCFAVGRKPPLFAMLAPGALKEGAVLRGAGDLAKRLLGMGLDELQADALQLTLRSATEDNALHFDATASLSGQAQLAGRQLTLSAELTGVLVADRKTGRMVLLELSGPLDVGSDGAAESDKSAGTGTLSIRRVVGPQP